MHGECHSTIARLSSELSFKKGDLIRVRRQIDSNWYEGELNRKVGIVPSNYVELAAVAKPDQGLKYTEVEEFSEGRAKAMYHFEPRVAAELPMRRGDMLTVTKRIDANWLEGRNVHGQSGIFPANYVQIMNEPIGRQRRELTVVIRSAVMRS